MTNDSASELVHGRAGSLTMKCADGVNYLALLRIGYSGEKWKTEQAIRQIFGDWTVAVASAKPQAHRGQLQRQIMKHGEDPKTGKMRD